MVGGSGSFQYLYGEDGNDTLVSGGTSALSLIGGNGADSLIGSNASSDGDRLNGGSGNDTLNGGDGRDWADYGDATGAVTIDLVAGTSSGGAGVDILINIENILAGSGHDSILGSNVERQELSGGSGNDTIIGGGGADQRIRGDMGGFGFGFIGDDSLVGGTGSGEINGDNGNDTIVGGSGNFRLLYGGAGNDSMVCGNGVQTWLYGGFGNDTLSEGNYGAGQVLGEEGDDWLISFMGGALSGGTGNDTLLLSGSGNGDDGNDSLVGGAQLGQISGGAGNDTLIGGIGGQSLVGGAGNDSIIGTAGADLFFGDGIWDPYILAGDDTFLGGGGADWLSYEILVQSTRSITVSFVSGEIMGAGGNDRSFGIRNILASAGNDCLVGDGFDNSINGYKGADTIVGEEGDDWVVYKLMWGVSVDLALGRVTGGFYDGNNDSLIGIENVQGSTENDSLLGNSFSNKFDGLGGNDTIVGGEGFDEIFYIGASNGVTVNLVTRRSSGADGNDSFIGIEGFTGSNYADSFLGDGGGHTFDGGSGNDTLNGGLGLDWISYASATSGVTINLQLNRSDGAAGVDSLIGFEGAMGSSYSDSFLGNAADQTLDGGAGDDTLDGGLGLDWVSYASASAGVTVDLRNSRSSGAVGADSLIGIEGVTGSSFSDMLFNSNINGMTLSGGSGNDTLIAQGASTWLEGGSGDDVILVGNADLASILALFQSP
jgi:Ca2+-binding RTX toxin-like protein